MKKAITILFISFLIACNKKVNPSDITKINGYWEIEKVILPDGTEKKYTINETIDYFKVNNNKGFRKKVTPQLDGTFLVNDDYENVEIKVIDEIYFINYSTSYSKWKEKILTINDDKLVTINDAKNEYHYKRASSINIIPNGKTTK